MKKELSCLRCNGSMQLIMYEKLQLGQTGWFLGDLPNLFAGSLDVAIYACQKCGKLEFYQINQTDEDSEIAQKKCPRCGKEHDFDYPKCPFCKYDYYDKYIS